MTKPAPPHRWPDGRPMQDGSDVVHQPEAGQGVLSRNGASPQDPVIAELERARDAAVSANEAKSRYLMAISHEIRSPLNAIYGYAQLLERGDAVPCAEAGAAIRRSVDHLTNLAEGLLEISRVESDVLKIQADVTNVRELLEDVVSMFRAQAMAKGLDLKLTLGNTLPTMVKTDQKRLRQVLINLVSNAIKYTDAGGVDVAVRYRSQVATIEVSDTGIGIDPGDMKRVFEPFERGSSKSVQSQPGIGLGLTITRVLAQVMGGDVTATSTPGAGSCFQLKLMLPTLSIPVTDKSAGTDIEGYEGPRRTVLLIDDDPDQRAAVRTLLQSLDFVVFVAETGIAGIGLAEKCAPDIVLLDLQMPQISGWETAKRLRSAHGSALKIVLMSAGITAADASDPDGQVHDAFLAKPIACDALFSAMQKALGLEWSYVKTARPATPRRAVSLGIPVEARPLLEQLRQFAQIGHVLGVEERLAEFEQAFPAAEAFSAMLWEHLEDFDFTAIVEKIDNA